MLLHPVPTYKHYLIIKKVIFIFHCLVSVKLIVYPELMKEHNAFQNTFFPFSQIYTTKAITKKFLVVQWDNVFMLVRAGFDPDVRSLVEKE